jgi:hypothetical protein
MSKLINEGLMDWIADLIVTRKLRQAERLFANDPLLKHRFKEFRVAEENLRQTWEEICAERKGTSIDCDEMDKRSQKPKFRKDY